jgi:succinate dehydrogenase/fumarate reductase flavoprotein subunit
MIQSQITLDGLSIPLTSVDTLIVGAGAAGMGCALHLHDFLTQAGIADAHERILVVTRARAGGASRMSGSDKQTYYKMGTSPRVPDTALDFARTLTAFGCMHGDAALAEACGSLRGFYGLVDAGVPFPHDPEGAFIGYKTDHDPYERATSAGPKTSKYMSECIEARLKRARVRVLDRLEIVRLLTTGEGDKRRVAGLLALDRARVKDPDLGLRVFRAENVVLAAGGPGAIYASTVYPAGQSGIHGVAFEAGLAAHNMTESQYGLASVKFRWNVSGTYMQVIPRIFSTAKDGKSAPREFLAEYFPTMERLATCIFLKGYQWPFDAQRIVDHQSSLVDMAVHRETVQRGRRVWMDFLQNPIAGPGMKEFSLDAVEDEARTYLRRTGATQRLPIERLAHMNQPAIDIYSEHGIDLTREPLEIAVCAQHHNGGFVVDKWWQSTLPRAFVIGEMAGTHGVKRPGGAALNSGQVGALRSAEFIANVCGSGTPAAELPVDTAAQAAEAAQGLKRMLSGAGPDAQTPKQVLADIARRMTARAAHLRDARALPSARAEAVALYRKILQSGFRLAGPADLPRAIEARSACLTHVAFLRALEDYVARGGGSRGSYVVLDSQGAPMPQNLVDASAGEAPHMRHENQELRKTVQELRFAPEAEGMFDIRIVPVRPIPERDLAFEPAWSAFREKRIFGEK